LIDEKIILVLFHSPKATKKRQTPFW